MPNLILAQLNPEPKAITEKYFPDPDIEINTPGFAKKRGFTEYKDMMPFLQDLKDKHPDKVSLQFIGQSQKGKDIPLLIISSGSKKGQNKLKVWLQGGLHGNEPASTEGLLYLMQQILEDPSYNYLLDSLEIAFLPMANIDGMNRGSRYAANGLDLNRDQTKLMAPESVVLKKAFNDFNPQVAVDFHEYRPYRRDYARLSSYGVTVPHDVMFLYSGNLNVPESLRRYVQKRFVKNAGESLNQHELRFHDYFSSTKVFGSIQFNQGSKNARSSATSYALANTVSSLVEIRGVGIGRTSFKRRVFSTFLVAKSYLETAWANPKEVRDELAKARAAKGLAHVTTKRKVEPQPVQMIDIDTEETIALDGIVRDAWESSPDLSRSRPSAYIILPENEAIVEKLKILGLEVEQLSTEKTMKVEAYSVSEYQQFALKYEGVHRQEVKTQLLESNYTFPAGTWIVHTDQQRGNLAIEVLEPEAPNSLVSFGVFTTAANQLLPYFRYLEND